MSSSAGYSSLPPYGCANSRVPSLFAVRRPWREFVAHPSSYSIPRVLVDFASRFKRNLAHFRVNYAMIMLFILFLSLLFRPISLIVFLITSVFWFLFYFHRDEPIVLFNVTVDDRVVLLGLWIVTIVSLVLTRVWLNVLVSLLIGAAAVVLHATFRVAEDLFLDEDELANGGMQSVVGARF
ncbi:hypothetical protein OROGR_019446 [Orobanche gracilis]